MCGLLEGLVQGRPTHGPAEAWIGQIVATFGGSPCFLARSPRTGFWLCLMGRVVSLTEQAVPSSSMDTARLPPQLSKEPSSVGADVDPTPRLECGRQNPESISSFKKKDIY